MPFPSVSRFNDEVRMPSCAWETLADCTLQMSPERRSNDRTPHGRVVSSPTLPDWYVLTLSCECERRYGL